MGLVQESGVVLGKRERACSGIDEYISGQGFPFRACSASRGEGLRQGER